MRYPRTMLTLEVTKIHTRRSDGAIPPIFNSSKHAQERKTTRSLRLANRLLPRNSRAHRAGSQTAPSDRRAVLNGQLHPVALPVGVARGIRLLRHRPGRASRLNAESLEVPLAEKYPIDGSRALEIRRFWPGRLVIHIFQHACQETAQTIGADWGRADH